jgi:RNA 3'-terminal phosphate cyclase-like protein
MNSNNNTIKIKGSNYFRLKVAYSLLLNRPIEISDIRANDINPGLTDYEISFLKLIELITNGTKIEISKTGTLIKFTPGVITNNYGNEFEFECHPSRGITYYAEGLIPISLFGKESLSVILNGITNCDDDISVDTFKSVTCALLQKLVIGDSVICDIKKRGVYPKGSGLVKFKCPIVTLINPFDWIEEGKIKKIRGTSFTCKIPASFSTRMIDTSRRMFNNFLPDVWIAVDNYKDKNKDEISPGYGLSLIGETTNEFYVSYDIVNYDNLTPENVAEKCCLNFLEEIYNV